MESFLSSSKPEEKIQERISFDFPQKILYENRYCKQNDFSILVCRGRNNTCSNWKSVFKLNGSELEYKHFALMTYERSRCKTAIINSELFVLGGCLKNNKFDKSIRKFRIKNKTWSWKTQTCLNDNKFCLCSFKKNLYVVSGKSFCIYNFKNNQWIQKAKMNQTRSYAACTVFEGKIFVTGGMYKWIRLQSVKAYDYHQNR